MSKCEHAGGTYTNSSIKYIFQVCLHFYLIKRLHCLNRNLLSCYFLAGHKTTWLNSTDQLGVGEEQEKSCCLCSVATIDIAFQINELPNKERSSLIKVNKLIKKVVQSELSLLLLLNCFSPMNIRGTKCFKLSP